MAAGVHSLEHQISDVSPGDSITGLTPSLAAGDIPRCFAGNGLTKVISHIVSEAGGEPELGASWGKEGARDQEKAQGDMDHDVTERRLVTITIR